MQEEIEEVEKEYEHIFTFALIWSVCCTTNLEGRERLNLFVKELMHKEKSDFPEEGSIYDYVFTMKEKKWQHWLEGVPPLEVDSKLEYPKKCGQINRGHRGHSGRNSFFLLLPHSLLLSSLACSLSLFRTGHMRSI